MCDRSVSLATVRGASLAWLPEMSVLRVDGAGTTAAAPRSFTLMRNTAHPNVIHPAREKAELVPAENTLTVVPGFIGAYPNAFYRVDAAERPAFEKALRTLASEQDYRALANRFAVRRTSADFRAFSDALPGVYQARWPTGGGPVRPEPVREPLSAAACCGGLVPSRPPPGGAPP